MEKKAEIYYQMEAESGRTVRVPASQLKKWMEGQEAIAKGKEPDVSEEDIARLLKEIRERYKRQSTGTNARLLPRNTTKNAIPGIKYQDVVDDNSHSVYLYKGDKVGYFTIVGKADYQDGLALSFRKEIDNGRIDRRPEMLDKDIESLSRGASDNSDSYESPADQGANEQISDIPGQESRSNTSRNPAESTGDIPGITVIYSIITDYKERPIMSHC